MSTAAVSAVVPRVRTTVRGRVDSVQARSRPWTRFEVVLTDLTGSITLRFMGRSVMPGIEAGRRLFVEGTASVEGDRLVMLNPLYSFLPDECAH
jgi:hypothetical protein